MGSITCRGESLLRKTGTLNQKKSPGDNNTRLILEEPAATERIYRQSNLLKDGNSPNESPTKPKDSRNKMR